MTIDLSKKYGIHSHLLDISQSCIDFAQRYAEKKQVDCSFTRADILETPFEDDTFDLVWNSGVNQYFLGKDRQTVFDQMIRVCKPGGHVIVCVPNRLCIPRELHVFTKKHLTHTWSRGPEKSYTPGEIKKRLSSLSNLQVHGVGVFDAFTFLLPARKRSRLAQTIKQKVDKKTTTNIGDTINTKNPLSKILGWQLIAIGQK